MKNSFGHNLLQALKNAPVTLFLLLVCTVMMLVEVKLSGSKELTVEAVQALGGLGPKDYSIHLLTYMFLHGSVLHICVNMFALLSLGLVLEARWSSIKFTVIYLIAGLVGGLFATTFSSINTLTVGASGAIVGLIGADFMNHIYYKAYQTKKGKTNMIVAMFDMAILVMISFIPNISWLGHLGGFVGGVTTSLIISMILKNDNLIAWRQTLEPKKNKDLIVEPTQDRVEPTLEQRIEIVNKNN